MIEIQDGVVQIPLIGASAIALLEDRVTIIDTGSRGSSYWLFRAMRSLGRRPEEIARIVLTHYHFDHMGAVREVLHRTGAEVLAHRVEAPFLAGEQRAPNPVRIDALAPLTTGLFRWCGGWPFHVDRPIDDGYEIDVLGGARVIHVPGHTPGSIAIHLPARRLLIVGDAVRYSFRKLGVPPRVYSEDPAAARESIRKLASLDFDTIAFSHFPPIRKDAKRRLTAFAESLG